MKQITRTPHSNIRNAYILAIVVIAFVVFISLFNKQYAIIRKSTNPAEEKQKPPAEEVQPTVVEEKVQTTDLDIKGHVLFVKEGDLWRMDFSGKNPIKLIDLDTIVRGSRSPISNLIAYTLRKTQKETVKEYDGTTKEVDVNKMQLLLADEKGTNSILIADSVDEWGWIPSTNLLWYETAVLDQYFGWDYFGKGEVWIFDPTTKKANKFIEAGAEILSLHRPRWSPDGTKLMFINGDMIKIADRFTSVTRDVYTLPYVGGDRGGPQPIPALAWSPDSMSIYTVFSPLIFNETDNNRLNLKSKHVYAFQIPINGGSPIKLMPEVPTLTAISEEGQFRAQFSQDFSSIIYPRVLENGFLVLEMYSIEDKRTYTLLDNLGNTDIYDSNVYEGFRYDFHFFPYNSHFAWIADKYVYIISYIDPTDEIVNFEGGGSTIKHTPRFLRLEKVDFHSGEKTTIVEYPGNIEYPYFIPGSESLFFKSGNFLYSAIEDHVVPISEIDGNFLNDTHYYPE